MKRPSAFAIRRGGGLTTWPEEKRKNPLALIRPFRALRYTAAAGPLAELVAPPYDVIDEKERARLAAVRATNVIHLDPAGRRRALSRRRRAARELAAKRCDRAGRRAGHAPLRASASEHDRVHERWGVLAALKLEPLRRRYRHAARANPRRPQGGPPPLDPCLSHEPEPDLRAPSTRPSARPARRDRHAARRVPRPAPPSSIASGGSRTRLRTPPSRIESPRSRCSSPMATTATRSRSHSATSADGSARADDELRAYDFPCCAFSRPLRDEGLVVLPTHRLLADPPPIEGLLERWRQVCSVEERDDPALLWRELVCARRCRRSAVSRRPRARLAALLAAVRGGGRRA